MGRYTDEKYEYDLLVVEWFRAKGYIAEIVGGPGMADVVAYHPKTKRFAICEVKSPNERDASPAWKTEYNAMSMNRKRVLRIIGKEPGYRENPGLWRLYAFTITSQLYTYWRKADLHAAAVTKRLNCAVQPKTCAPMAAVPEKNKDVFMAAADALARKGIIKGIIPKNHDSVVIATVLYFK